MRLIFVHGWSVTHTSTYGDLPQSLATAGKAVGLAIDIKHIYLGKYISFHDEVSMDDIARALQRALEDLPDNWPSIQPFSCITHSTGGPVVRYWLDKYHSENGAQPLPLKHLLMLAPANHGSSLAALGKQRVGRIKAWFSGVEPGQRVLDWLSLGSEGQWRLNQCSLNYNYLAKGCYPFVFIGQAIDSKFYDFLNSYLVEAGSDGVVRVAGANMNYRFLAIQQSPQLIAKVKPKCYQLRPCDSQVVRVAQTVPLAVFGQFSHSGRKMGIMANKAGTVEHQLLVEQLLACLKVDSVNTYQQRAAEMQLFTKQQQTMAPADKKQAMARYCMLVIRVCDQYGEVIEHHDYDILLLAGKAYKPNQLPKGFLVDKQMNTQSHCLVYYLDADKMSQIKDGCFGIQVLARPNKGFSFYHNAQFRSEGLAIEQVFAANQTSYLDIRLHREVDENVFRFVAADKPRASFKGIKPSGNELD